MDLTARSPNHLLASLPEADFAVVRPHLRLIELVQGDVLARTGDIVPRVYFPHNGIISLIIRLAEGETVEFAMIGHDSIFGASSRNDDEISLHDAIVQLPGTASTLDLMHFRKAVDQSRVFQNLLVKHRQALLAQAQQSAACNACHTVESRLSRRLLHMHDLSDSNELPLTQGFLAQMMGVQRNSVSLVANTLQLAGLIHYQRGHLEITNLEGLREVACGCYDTVKAHRSRLLNLAAYH
ncbi:MAG: Crp/Fnr family transcriptional regulator [Beijerinckiaceae bacterium]|nr:Crp/Fnr family transcriptional regulator [Beijerinckiaceae bacterium]